MQSAARTPPFGIAVALGLLAGVGGCLMLSRLPPWPMLAAAFAIGFGLWLQRDGGTRIAGVLLLGFGLAGLHAAATLTRQLPAALEQRDAVVSGRVVELPVVEPRRTRFLFRVDADAAQPLPLRGRLLRLSWYVDGKLLGRGDEPYEAQGDPAAVASQAENVPLTETPTGAGTEDDDACEVTPRSI